MSYQSTDYGVPSPAVEIRRRDAMYARVTREYELFVAGTLVGDR